MVSTAIRTSWDIEYWFIPQGTSHGEGSRRRRRRFIRLALLGLHQRLEFEQPRRLPKGCQMRQEHHESLAKSTSKRQSAIAAAWWSKSSACALEVR